MQKFVIYRRLSRDSKSGGNLGLEAQQVAVDNYLKAREHHVVSSYYEVETGTRKGNNRPALKQALADCKEHKATLIVATLSRLSRNVHFTSGLLEANVDFIALDLPSCDKTMLYFMSAISEWEADTISKRTKAALGVLKDRGIKLGPKYKPLTAEISAPHRQKWNEKRKQNSFSYAEKMYPTLKFFKNEGLNNSQIAEKLNDRGDATPSGKGKWQSITVQRCLDRVEKP